MSKLFISIFKNLLTIAELVAPAIIPTNLFTGILEASHLPTHAIFQPISINPLISVDAFIAINLMNETNVLLYTIE